MERELYQNLGFKENPFSRFSAEEELEYLEDIFIHPKYYQTIYSNLQAGASRFIFGERGIGKSALMFKLKNQLENEKKFAILIDRYDEIPLKNNNKEFLLEVLKVLTTNFSIMILKNPFIIKSLNKYDKEKLAFFINTFFKSLSRTEFEEIYNKATSYKDKNIFKKFFNWLLLKPINITISGASEFISSTVSNSLGLNNPSREFYKSYIPELQLKHIEESKINIKILEYKRIKEFLNDLVGIIKKTGYDKAVIFFDKIDEYQELGGNIDLISEFLKEIISDTNLLYLNDLSLVFVLWNKIKGPLNTKGLRCDKFKARDITWTTDEIERILESRLKHFSIDSEKSVIINGIIKEKKYLDEIYNIANGSPRHLIMLLSSIYDEQAILDSNVNEFSNEAIERGMLNFIKNFDYHSIYPGKSTTKDYIVNVINKILKVGKVEFEIKDMVATYKISNQSASSIIQKMRNYALIDEIDNTGSKAKRYLIIEPKIKYLVNNKINKLE